MKWMNGCTKRQCERTLTLGAGSDAARVELEREGVLAGAEHVAARCSSSLSARLPPRAGE
jgi:hypothetical protein